jgi:hypothetical protein
VPKQNFLNLKTAALAVLTVLASANTLASPSDPVVFTFSTVGDSRIDPTVAKADPTILINGALLPQDAQWLQNTKAWSRILRTVHAQKSNMLFMNGDMIMGYGKAAIPPSWSTTAPATVNDVVNSDLVKFYTQYAYWRGMVANSLETGTYIVPVPGNHETQCNSANVSTAPAASQVPCASGKKAAVENENAWRANMGDLIDDLSANVRFQSVTGLLPLNASGLTSSTAPTSTTDAAISTDQSKLSYSFDVNTSAGRLHFAIVNTDAVGFDGHAPTGWLANDLATAKTNGAKKFFVFGHKPAFTYQYLASGSVAAAGLDNDLAARNEFWKVISQYNATYFTGHEHITKVDQHPDPTGTYTTMPYQVLVGAGGSPWDAKNTDTTIDPANDRSYIWATVRVLASGKVTMATYGFSNTFGPTALVERINKLQ